MQIAILQPSYLPWLGYFDQMARADVFVYLDDVQYTRRDWRNRNRIRTANGWMWLTVPVLSRGRFEQSIKDTRIDPSPVWKSKHLAALRHNYARAQFFDHYFNELSAVYGRGHAFLAELFFQRHFRHASALLVDLGNDHICTEPQQCTCGFVADASACAGDYDRFATQGVGTEVELGEDACHVNFLKNKT